MAALVGTSLGDIILAAVLKDPEVAGRLVAQAISEAEPPEASVGPHEPQAEPKSEAKAETLTTTSTQRAAE